MASLDDPSDTHGRLIAASQVNGTSVYNLAGEKRPQELKPAKPERVDGTARKPWAVSRKKTSSV